VLDTGVGLADMRAITYRDGRPYLDRGRVWYTMPIRGRQLPHHLQGVFSMDPSVFDLKLEGIILFDRDVPNVMIVLSTRHDDSFGRQGLGFLAVRYYDPSAERLVP